MKKFLSVRYVPKELLKDVKIYMLSNGVFKECLPFVITRKVVHLKNIYCDFDEMPLDIQQKYEDMVISEDDNLSKIYFTKKGGYIYDNNKVKVVINENTYVLPIVGNLLPSDDVTPYTVLFNNGNYVLVPILISLRNHWSLIYTGGTRYGNNVFCLASELPKEKLEEHADEIIMVKDVPNYLSAGTLKDKKDILK